MPFHYDRTIHFQDTDAAGVVYFAQIFSICHEAYEAALQQAGISLADFFTQGAIAVPITHAQADFRRPLRCGDRIVVQLQPCQTAFHRFEIEYTLLTMTDTVAAIATTCHTCIETATRQRHPLPTALTQWLHQATAAEPSANAAAEPG